MVLQGDGNAELRIAVSKVRCSIKGIDNPTVAAFGSNPIGLFLGQNGVIWKTIPQHFNYAPLRFPIH
jgi:hypothetical protein